MNGVQVYKGKLKTGEQVAVKVQRPYVLETVTVDLHIIRQAQRPLVMYELIPVPQICTLLYIHMLSGGDRKEQPLSPELTATFSIVCIS